MYVRGSSHCGPSATVPGTPLHHQVGGRQECCLRQTAQPSWQHWLVPALSVRRDLNTSPYSTAPSTALGRVGSIAQSGSHFHYHKIIRIFFMDNPLS
jgi:hypothetical protein